MVFEIQALKAAHSWNLGLCNPNLIPRVVLTESWLQILKTHELKRSAVVAAQRQTAGLLTMRSGARLLLDKGAKFFYLI